MHIPVNSGSRATSARTFSHTLTGKQPYHHGETATLSRKSATLIICLYNDTCTRPCDIYRGGCSNCLTTETSCGSEQIPKKVCVPWNWSCTVPIIPSRRFWTQQERLDSAGHCRRTAPMRCSWSCCSRKNIRKRLCMFCRTIPTSIQSWPGRA